MIYDPHSPQSKEICLCDDERRYYSKRGTEISNFNNINRVERNHHLNLLTAFLISLFDLFVWNDKTSTFLENGIDEWMGFHTSNTTQEQQGKCVLVVVVFEDGRTEKKYLTTQNREIINAFSLIDISTQRNESKINTWSNRSFFFSSSSNISKRKRLFQYFHLYANGIRYTRYRVKRLQESIYLCYWLPLLISFFMREYQKKEFF